MKILKGIIVGALIGAALFFVPFILIRVLFFILIISFIFRLFRGQGRWGRRSFSGWGGRKQFAFADYIRGMSDEEYGRFKNHFQEEEPWGCYRNNQKENNK